MSVAERLISDRLAQDLAKYRGQWVAIKDARVVAASAEAADLLKKLREKRVTGAALHRVPEDPRAVYIL